MKIVFKNLIQKYISLSKPIKAALWFTIMSVFQKGLVFLVTPIYTRILSTSEYGYYSLFTTWFSFFSIFATLNLAAGGFNNAMLKYEKERHRFVSSMMGLGNTCTVIVFFVVYFLLKQLAGWDGLDNFSIICIFIVLLVSPAFECWCSAQRFEFNYKLMCVVTLLQAVLVPVVSVTIAFFLNEKKYSLVLGFVIVQVIIGLIFYIYNLFAGRVYYDKEYWLFALKFNIPLIPHYISAIVLGQSDRLMIDYYCGESQVGVYSLGYSISLLVSVFVTAISTVHAPWLFKQIKVNNFKDTGKVTNYILVIVGGVTVFSALIGPEIIMILGTQEYSEAKWILPPVMLSCYMTLLYGFFANVEFYYERSYLVMVASVVAALSNILLNALCIPRYGFIVAGYTTLISYILLTVMHFAFMKVISKGKNNQELYDERFMFVFSIIVCGFVLMSMLLYKYTLIRYIIVLVGMVVVVLNKKFFLKVLARMRE